MLNIKKLYGLKEVEGLRKVIFDAELINSVKTIIDNVIKYGDEALLKYCKEFDKVELKQEDLRVSDSEIRSAYRRVSNKEIEAIEEMKRRVKLVEETTLKSLNGISLDLDGIKIERYYTPIQSVGCYIPAGKARYPSTIVMCVIPAKVAGVDRVIITTPPSNRDIDPLMLVTADLCNVDEVYRVGGAQAIAAMAYGTDSIRPVDKIVGPGSIFVTIAKYLVSNKVSIDMLAGPTELVVLADKSADPKFIAYDIIAQAEHSNDTLCGLVTDSEEQSKEVVKEIETILINAERSEIIKESLSKNGFIIICKDMEEAIKAVEVIAPEHLEIFTKDAHKICKNIRSAGLKLIGKYSVSTASDYYFGTNHVLPTLSFGKVRGSLSCLDFLKLNTVAEASYEGLKKVYEFINILSNAEGLPNHAKAVGVRL